MPQRALLNLEILHPERAVLHPFPRLTLQRTAQGLSVVVKVAGLFLKHEFVRSANPLLLRLSLLPTPEKNINQPRGRVHLHAKETVLNRVPASHQKIRIKTRLLRLSLKDFINLVAHRRNRRHEPNPRRPQRVVRVPRKF